MKAVLVMSTALDKSIEHTKWQQPLGLAYIAACVRDIADVSIIDCEVDDQYTKTLIKEIDTDDQVVVGFSANTYSYPEALRLAELVKERKPEAHINFGGYHVTPLADLVLKNRSYIDSVIRGDGEVPFRQLLLALSNGNDLSKVGSLTYRDDWRILSNPDAILPDLDSLPYPARDLLHMEKLFDNFKNSILRKAYGKSRIVSINANRGCPNQCIFCSIFNKKFRQRDPINIINEFEYSINKYGADLIYLVGDNLNLNINWLSKLCDEILNRNLDINWIALTMNPQKISTAILSKMEQSGCVRAGLGFESASQEMIDSLNKGLKVNKYRDVINLINKTNIDLVASFILGAPGESENTLTETKDFIESSNFKTCCACILTPLPGSKLFSRLVTMKPDLKYEDDLNLDELREFYVGNFCDVNFQRITEINKQIERLYQSLDLF